MTEAAENNRSSVGRAGGGAYLPWALVVVMLLTLLSA